MPIAVDVPSREYGSLVRSILVTHARVRLAPTGGLRHQDGRASTGEPIHGVNSRQRSYWETSAITSRPTGHGAGSAGIKRAIIEGASARGALGSCMRRRRDGATMQRDFKQERSTT